MRQNIGLFYKPKLHNKALITRHSRTTLRDQAIKSPPTYHGMARDYNGLHPNLQNELHQKLSQIFNRKGKGYSNPKLVANVIMFGLDRTWVERRIKDAEGMSANSEFVFKVRRQNLAVKGKVDEFDEILVELNEVDQLKEVQDLNLIRHKVRGVVPFIVIESQSYRIMIPDYIRALFHDMIVYSIMVRDGLADVMDPLMTTYYMPTRIIRSEDDIVSPQEIGCVYYPTTDALRLALVKRGLNKYNKIARPTYLKVILDSYEDDHRRELFDRICYRLPLESDGARDLLNHDHSGKSAMRVIMKYGIQEDFPQTADDISRSPKVALAYYVVSKLERGYGIRDFAVQRLHLSSFFSRALLLTNDPTRRTKEAQTIGMNTFHITASKALGKTTFIDLFLKFSAHIGCKIDIIDSDDYGMWLEDVMPPYVYGQEVKPPTLTLDSISKRASQSYFNTAMSVLLKQWKIKSVTDVRVLLHSGMVHTLAMEFNEIFFPLFQRGSPTEGTLHQYIQMRKSLSSTFNLLTCAHNNIESVHMAFTTANFNLIAPWTSQSGLIERHLDDTPITLSDILLGLIYDYNQTQDVPRITLSLAYEWMRDTSATPFDY